MGFAPSDSALLWVMCAPAGPYFPHPPPRALRLLAAPDAVRAWPGGTGGHKLSLNYGPTVVHQRAALAAGFDMNLWLLGDVIAEAGVMNFFVVLKRADGGEWFNARRKIRTDREASRG